MSPQDIMWLALGAAALIVAIGIAVVCAKLASVLGHTDTTLDKVEQVLDSIQPATAKTLNDVSGIAGNINSMVGRVDRLTQALETAKNAVAKAADKAQTAVSPTVANVLGVVAGISRGAQTFFRSRHNGPSGE
jgi:uncharacterized protein YoxC